jgi:hypothetical protein
MPKLKEWRGKKKGTVKLRKKINSHSRSHK